MFGLIAAAHRADGTREAISDWTGPLELRVISPTEQQVSQASRDSIPELLSERFGLPGFTLGPDGRVR